MEELRTANSDPIAYRSNSGENIGTKVDARMQETLFRTYIMLRGEGGGPWSKPACTGNAWRGNTFSNRSQLPL